VDHSPSETLSLLFSQLRLACSYFYSFDCSKSLAAFEKLSLHQYNTGWVLSMVAQIHFEMAEYKKVWLYSFFFFVTD
jgi:hypothetical protein